MISCIYTITNLINNKIYVGCTVDLSKRKNLHFKQLRTNKHGNVYLQAAWNKYGEESFRFEILEECNKEFLKSQENYWCNTLNVHNINYGYNIQPTNPNGNITHSKETIIKISNSRKGSIGANLNKKLSIEVKEKISKSKKNVPLNKKEVYQYNKDGSFIKKWNNMLEAINTLNIKSHHLSEVLKNKRKSAEGFIWKY